MKYVNSYELHRYGKCIHYDVFPIKTHASARVYLQHKINARGVFCVRLFYAQEDESFLLDCLGTDGSIIPG